MPAERTAERRSRAPALAGVAVIVGLVVASVGGLTLMERRPVPPPGPGYTVALPAVPVADVEPPEVAAAPDEPAATVDDVPPTGAAEPEAPAVAEPMEPTLVVALGGLGWNEQLADIAHRALPTSVAFTLPSDHPAVQQRMGTWRQQGRDVVLVSGDPNEVEALLAAHPAAAGVLVADADLHTRRDPEPWPARYLDASTTDPQGFTAALREATEQARNAPPSIVVIELYPGLVPQLATWMDQLQQGGYRLVRPIDLAEANP